MSGSFDDNGQLVIADGRILVYAGKKKSGKSVLALLMFRSYPYDKIVIDVNGDDGPNREDTIMLSGTAADLPRTLRRPMGRKGPVTWLYVPDPGSPTLNQDLDAVVGLALKHGKTHGHCALLIHETGVQAPVHQCQPNMRRALMHNRHNGLTMMLCMPRTLEVETLIIHQADVVYVFDLPNFADRKKIANTIGMKVDDFEDAWEGLGPHEYLRYDANEPKPVDGEKDFRLVHYPALPLEVVNGVNRWANKTQ